MESVALQYINPGPLIFWALVLYVIVPIGLCAFAGLLRTNRGSGAATGAVLGLLTMAASMGGCNVLDETNDFASMAAFVWLAVGIAGVGAAVTYWVTGFWRIK